MDCCAVQVPVLEEAILIQNSCRHYNHRNNGIDALTASASSDRLFLERITVNYLRHALSNYESELVNVPSEVGAGYARVKIKEKVLDAIAAAYPSLRAECLRQKTKSQSDAIFVKGPEDFLTGFGAE